MTNHMENVRLKYFSIDLEICIQNHDVECPVCNRTETFDGNKRSLARGWLTEHINIEHRDKLPSYKNGEK
jgi:hypothetical protein